MFDVSQQVQVPIAHGKMVLETELRIDLLVNDSLIVELKMAEKLLPVHEAQLLTYIRLLSKPQGLLINFYTDNITKSMRPLVNEYFNRLPD